jgi:hypothetical protein
MLEGLSVVDALLLGFIAGGVLFGIGSYVIGNLEGLSRGRAEYLDSLPSTERRSDIGDANPFLTGGLL